MTNSKASQSRDPLTFDQRPDDGRGGKVVPLRLQKFLARAGVASRRKSEDLITAGRVTVNGCVADQLGTKVDPLCDRVEVDGRTVMWGEGPVTLMLHKPAGVITTMRAQSEVPIVADLVPQSRYPGLYPVGRLDRDTTGLLLFSTDGDLGQMLLHPSHHVAKTYDVRIERPLGSAEAQSLRQGVMLDDGPTAPAQLFSCDGGGKNWTLTIHEGRYHQVKRMFEAVGHKVCALHRSQVGPLRLGNLPVGKWRLLNEAEVAALRAASIAADRGAAVGKDRAPGES